MIENIIGLYCNHCRRDVEAIVEVYLDSIAKFNHNVLVCVSANCPDCDVPILWNESWIELSG